MKNPDAKVSISRQTAKGSLANLRQGQSFGCRSRHWGLFPSDYQTIDNYSTCASFKYRSPPALYVVFQCWVVEVVEQGYIAKVGQRGF